MTDLTRRKFIQLSVVSSAVAAAGLSSGCQGGRDEVTGTYGGTNTKGLPYVNQPPGATDGIPQYFATTCAMCPAGCGLIVRTMGGRAVKVEGNPGHPVNLGKTCAMGQASLQHLYNPRRLRFPQMRASQNEQLANAPWDQAIAKFQAALAKDRGHIAVIVDGSYSQSPSALSAIGTFCKQIGATPILFSIIDDSPWRDACEAVYGVHALPSYGIDQADAVVAFGANFLEAWPSPVYYGRLYGEFRRGAHRAAGEHGYFAYVGPRMSMTAANADEWFACNPGTESVVASGLISALGGPGVSLADAARISGLDPGRLTQLAGRLKQAGTRAVAMAGDGILGRGDSSAQIQAVESLNVALKSMCIGFGPQGTFAKPAIPQLSSQQITHVLQSNGIRSVVLVGQPNMVFVDGPNGAVKNTLSKMDFVGALGVFVDETSQLADICLPIRSFLEDWSISEPIISTPGQKTASIGQAIIDPQYVLTNPANGQSEPWMDTRSMLDLLGQISGKPGLFPGSEDFARSIWAKTAGSNTDWLTAVAQGGAWSNSAAPSRTVNTKTVSAPSMPALAPGEFALEVYPHLYWLDGRHSNLPWLQEIPDPMTAAVWNSWAEISLTIAESLGITTGDIVRITSPNGAIEIPALPSRGIHPQLIAIPMGQGHGADGYLSQGVNALPLISSASSGMTIVKLEKVRSAVAGYHPELNTLVTVQDMPNGQEPTAVQQLIHETAHEHRQTAGASGG